MKFDEKVYYLSSIVIVAICKLVLDPLEAVSEGRFKLTFHSIHIIRCHPLPPLHLRIFARAVAVEAKRFASIKSILEPEPGFNI